MAGVEGVKVHTHGRVKNSPNAGIDNNIFSFKGGSTGCVLITEPMTPLLNYYEYEILSKGAEASIGIGLGEKNYPLNRMPGWNRNSIGYHGDDGKLYHENGIGSRFGPTCTDGDKMGCGVDFDSEVEYGYHEVFFTKNGQLVGDPIRMKRPVHGLYPIIGLHSRGEKVRYLGHWHRQRQSLLEPMIQDHSPSNLWLRSNGIKYTRDSLTLEYCGTGGASQDVSIAQALYPLDRTNHYFELEILNTGSLGAIAIGVGKSSYPLDSHPGWSSGSVGYHADDGKLFLERGSGQEFGPVCVNGDRMGCGIVFEARDGSDGAEGELMGAGVEGDSGELDSDNVYSGDEEEEGRNLSDEDDLYDDGGLFYDELFEQERDRIFRERRPFGRNFDGGRGLFGRPYHHGGGGPFGFRRRQRGGQVQNSPFMLQNPQKSISVSSSSSSSSSSKCKVYFTKNGEKIGDIEVLVPKGGFFPLVGLLSKGEKVRVDLQPLTG